MKSQISNPFTFALPSGRLAEESLQFFKLCGIGDFEDLPSDRSLSIWDKEKKLRVLLVRAQDVPTYILQGGADAGITGRDVLMEGNYDLTVPFEFNFGHCRLSIASLPNVAPHLLQKSHLRVATKYINLASDFFYSSGFSYEIIKLHGSVEIAPILSLVDCIVDIVGTGQTLKENGLVEVETIMHSSSVLLVSRSAYALQTRLLSDMFNKFKTRISDSSH